jgi:hypothetical protein
VGLDGSGVVGRAVACSSRLGLVICAGPGGPAPPQERMGETMRDMRRTVVVLLAAATVAATTGGAVGADTTPTGAPDTAGYAADVVPTDHCPWFWWLENHLCH